MHKLAPQTLTVTFLLSLSGPVKAQSIVASAGSPSSANSRAQSATIAKTADNDWAALLALLDSIPKPNPNGKKTTADVAKERAQRIAIARQASQAAHDFYVSYPTSAYLAPAHKVEAVQSLLGVVDGDKEQESAAQRAATVYRADKTNPVRDRFEVAMLSERVANRSKLGGSANGNVPAELEKIADKLKAEFGDATEVYNFYVSIARGADMVTAKRIATSVLAWPSGPDAKAEAQVILTRDGLLNKPLPWTLTDVDSKDPLKLADQKGKVVLIYVCVPLGEVNALAPLSQYKKVIPPGVRLIYLELGATAEQAQASKATAPVPGTFCIEPRGVLGPSSERFGIRQTPYVFVLNSTGVLSGFGPLGDINTLLAAAK